ncbi:4-amino-4-deoxy-L-arabinose transferase [Desulfacinum hydrothermale DSM 13146]|uniref:4-amino-4-deoxy-L-arabinose transferase n=1 Tax=Desulfacinum hydrothermale DSM 13146 TaxID=1121390 RepID=A0A1W1XNG3_9BACT|nr:glycosyltransferase family 39 protein [Desulfacinum hydrothermale]SMC25446.1 4-amino-4-deoxy-L-arabinose transferase [Desulfacinum hydrothermale DSM 13146]
MPENPRVVDERRLLWLALCLALLVVTAFQGSRGLFDSTEGRYAECAREMVVTGDYLRPTLDFAPHWTKPPLTYWAIAAGLRLFGMNEWGARVYLIPTFLLTVFGVFWLGRGLWDRATGALAALVYATLWGPAAAAHTVNTDSLLAMWEILAVAAFWWGYRTEKAIPWTAMWLFFGLAFLTKGPPALVPLVAVLVFWALGRDKARSWPHLFQPLGLGLFLTTALSWYLYCVWRYPGLLGYWLGDEVVGRIFTSKFGRHPHWYEAFTVYWPFLLGGSCPWLVLLGWNARRFLYGLKRSRPQEPRGLRGSVAGSFRRLPEPWRFVVVGIAVPLVVFSLSRSRLPLYVLFLFAPVGCALARGLLSRVRDGSLSVRALVTTALVSALILVVGKGVYSRWPSKRNMGVVARSVRELGPAGEGRDVLLVSHRPHYGLQFYFADTLKRFYPTDKVTEPGFFRFSDLAAACRESVSSGRTALVLMRRDNVDRVAHYLEKSGLSVERVPLNRYWIALPCRLSGPGSKPLEEASSP